MCITVYLNFIKVKNGMTLDLLKFKSTFWIDILLMHMDYVLTDNGYIYISDIDGIKYG